MTLREALNRGGDYLRKKEVADAALDAWYLMQYAVKREDGTSIDRAWYFLHCEEQMQEADYVRYQSLLMKRGKRIPLQHITGEQEFMGLQFQVNKHVLIPRQDTEILVEQALKVLKPGMHVLDMCTGSGCIIISLMKLAPGILGTASDLSKEALETARENARLQEVCIDFRQGDLFAPIDGAYDVIVSNPPYIPTTELDRLMAEVRFYDPLQALDGREDGLYFYRQLTSKGKAFLKPGGWLMMEIGCEQGTDVGNMLKNEGFQDVRIIRDLAGLDRVAAGRRE